MPPSSDVFAKPERRRKPGSVRPKGKQPGASLCLIADPDEVVDVFPSVCGDCGTMLPCLSAGFARRRCHDIPPRSVAVTETRCG